MGYLLGMQVLESRGHLSENIPGILDGECSLFDIVEKRALVGVLENKHVVVGSGERDIGFKKDRGNNILMIEFGKKPILVEEVLSLLPA